MTPQRREPREWVNLSIAARFLAVFGLIGSALGAWALVDLLWLAPARPHSSDLFQSGGWIAALSFWWSLLLFAQGILSFVAREERPRAGPSAWPPRSQRWPHALRTSSWASHSGSGWS